MGRPEPRSMSTDVTKPDRYDCCGATWISNTYDSVSNWYSDQRTKIQMHWNDRCPGCVKFCRGLYWILCVSYSLFLVCVTLWKELIVLVFLALYSWSKKAWVSLSIMQYTKTTDLCTVNASVHSIYYHPGQVMLQIGKQMHAFDWDKYNDHAKMFPNELITILDTDKSEMESTRDTMVFASIMALLVVLITFIWRMRKITQFAFFCTVCLEKHPRLRNYFKALMALLNGLTCGLLFSVLAAMYTTNPDLNLRHVEFHFNLGAIFLFLILTKLAGMTALQWIFHYDGTFLIANEWTRLTNDVHAKVLIEGSPDPESSTLLTQSRDPAVSMMKL